VKNRKKVTLLKTFNAQEDTLSNPRLLINLGELLFLDLQGHLFKKQLGHDNSKREDIATLFEVGVLSQGLWAAIRKAYSRQISYK